MIIQPFLFLLFLSSSCQIDNCEFCSQKNPEICLNCNQGFTRDEVEGCRLSSDSDLLSWRIENCEFLSESSCEKCIEGYILTSGRCEPICESETCPCFSPGTCLHTIRSLSCDDYYCQTCDPSTNLCLICSLGYGLDLYKYCSTCQIYQCKDCGQDYELCNICNDGFYFDTNYQQCLQCSSSGCAECDQNNPDICNVCFEEYVSDYYGYCCDTSCLACSYNSPYCSECPEGTYLSLYCVSCLDHCKNCQDGNTCDVCEDGYELNYYGECLETVCNIRGCSSCPNSLDQCTECFIGYNQDENGNCCNSVCKTCSKDSAECSSCNNGGYLDSNICYGCSDNCKTCDAYNCKSCSDGYSLEYGECIKSEDSNNPSAPLAVQIIVPIICLGAFAL